VAQAGETKISLNLQDNPIHSRKPNEKQGAHRRNTIAMQAAARCDEVSAQSARHIWTRPTTVMFGVD
jgi:hypothetical protein